MNKKPQNTKAYKLIWLESHSNFLSEYEFQFVLSDPGGSSSNDCLA